MSITKPTNVRKIFMFAIASGLLVPPIALAQKYDLKPDDFWIKTYDACVKNQENNPSNSGVEIDTIKKYCECITAELRTKTNIDTWRDKNKFQVAARAASKICIIKMKEEGGDSNYLSVDQQLQYASNQINKSLPKTLDEHTRQDTTSVGPGKILTNFYTLTKLDPSIIDGDFVRSTLRPSIAAGYCSDPSMEFFRKNNITVAYSYRDKNGKFVTRFNVGTKDCR